jgi:cellulose synthase/poly-beta-1,6-N-acetylglucosamine synthase-like glycosyltransferase
MVLNTIIVFLVSLLIGTLGIYIGVSLATKEAIGFGGAALTALLGALAWGIVSFFLGWLPLVGALLALLAWIGVINIRHTGSWGTAILIGVVAWLVAGAALYALAVVGFVSASAVGIPGV